MKELTRGDVLHVYGSFGLNMDYTVRLCVGMKDEINGEMLSEAVRNTSKRYPYLSLQMKRDENRVYYEDILTYITAFLTGPVCIWSVQPCFMSIAQEGMV